jgi:benzylsuccinate CoA-transferase BbsF subunit
MSGNILEGIKVADFSWAYVGPLTAKTLADCGAEVIKIEGLSRPDVERALVPPFKDNIQGLNRGGHFNSVNTGKRSLCVNLATPGGIELAKRLVAWADIVIENFSGGAMERMGLGYEVLREIKPDIIMVSSAMQGQTGPDRDRAGFGQHLTSHSGIVNLAGWPDRDPTNLGYYTDFISPHFNLAAIFAALLHRKRTGKGQYLDMSQYEIAMHFMSPLILDYEVNQRIAGRMGNRNADASPHGAFRCAGDDRWCAIAVFTDEEWRSFCGVLGKPEWTQDPRFATLASRKENEDELENLIEEWTVQHTAEEVMILMQEAGVAAGVAQTGEDLLEHDPQLKERHFYYDLDHPEVGIYRAPRPPYLFSRCDFRMKRAPLLGEDNEYVLREIFALSDEEIAELVEAGAIEG